MRHLRLGSITALAFALQGCIDDAPGPADTAPVEVTDTAVEDADTADTTIDDTADATIDDTAIGDTAIDATADTADTSSCEPVSCTLWCEHGFADGPDGCPVCACRECSEAADCAALPCAKPLCTEAGGCSCDCDGVAPEPYACPDGQTVPWCACGERGWSCVVHPERACPTLCQPGVPEPWPCPDGAEVPWCTCEVSGCEPTCEHVGAAEEGWYDGCSGELIVARPCGGCELACLHIGTRSEGWYDACEGRVTWAFCGPRRTCAESPEKACDSLDCTLGLAAPFTCPDASEAPFCACDVPAAACEPTCRPDGDAGEGWYDPCTGELVAKGECAGCTLSCDAIGSKSEGWYSSCTGLVTWTLCATGTWACEPEPWRMCGEAR